jgi:poly-gamma-glutamate synthesis protein (capsule biosynthesis protein)
VTFGLTGQSDPATIARDVEIVAAGDICPGDHYFTLGHGTGTHLAIGHNPFAEIAAVLRAADVCIANLEGPIADVSARSSEPEAFAFRGPPRAAALMHAAGIDLLHLANNHILQHGIEAFEQTRALLGRESILPLGLLRDGRSEPVRRTVNGLRFGFLGYSCVPDRFAPGQDVYAAATVDTIVSDVRALACEVDHVVASLHWGTEGRTAPETQIVDAAHRLVEAGAKLVLGHHPHCFQRLERIGVALIAYSLGDLVFDLFWDPRLVESALLSVRFDADGVRSHRLIPVRYHRDCMVRFQGPREAARFLRNVETDAMPRFFRRRDSERSAAEVLRKLLFFVSQLHRGHTGQKVRFVGGKLKSLATALFRRGQSGRT